MAEAKRHRYPLRRPKTSKERLLAKWASDPRIRARISRALSKPIFPRDIYISGAKGEYVHFTLLPTSKFDKRSFRMKNLGGRGTRGIIGSPKGTWNDVTQRGRTGSRLQSVLVPKERIERLARSLGYRFESNPLLMTVMNPGYKKNPVDVEYDAKSKGYRVYRTNPGKSRRRRTMRYRKNVVPLWDNPEFGSLKTNPFDLAVTAMPLYNDNPGASCTSYCNNPSHDHADNIPASDAAGFQNNPEENIPVSEASGFQNNPSLPGYYGAIFNQNPRNPLTEEELSQLQLRKDENKHRASDELRGGNLGTSMEYHGRAMEDEYFGDTYRENPSLQVGDFVRNLKRVTKGMEIELEAKTLGRIVSAGQFMGDTVYSVQFFMPDGTQKIFKFFARELKREDSQLQFEENPLGYRDNPYRPASPRALQKYIHPKGGRGGYPKYGQLNHLSKQPASRAGVGGKGVNGTRKVKIPVAKFEAWLSSAGTPHEKRQYAKAKAAYRRFHKGADPEFITRQMVDIGTGNKQKEARSFAYSMGKSPFEPYITPKGSGKGPHKAYLHEYETMPEGLTVPGGKVVIKPLEGRTKITDWIHR